MALFELLPDSITEVKTTNFAEQNIKERQDLQRILREQLDKVLPESERIMVLAEEFGDWEESRRRIDLLALDEQANLVVVELKRTEDGGHMDLQAIRYAAMVSTMTFKKAVDAHTSYLKSINSTEDTANAANAANSILEFLGWDEVKDDDFAQDVKIILISADFSKELTSAVMWLNNKEVDIRCVRLKPYNLDGRILVDVQQIIPLPEAIEFQVQLKEKKQKEQEARQYSRDYTKYDVTLGDQTYENQKKNAAVLLVVKYLCDEGENPEEIKASMGIKRSNIFLCHEGNLDYEGFCEAIENDRKTGKRHTEPKRWFCTDDKLIHHGGKTYALSIGWGNGQEAEAINNLIDAYGNYSMRLLKSGLGTEE